MNRRALGAILVVLLAAAIVTWWLERDAGDWTRVGEVADIRSSGVTYVEESLVFVVAHESEITALAGWSPHSSPREERALYCRSSEMFVTPDHGELFDRRGVYYGGPAPRGLDRVGVKVENGQVLINEKVVRPGPDRGEIKVLQPQGALCSPDSEETTPGFLGTP